MNAESARRLALQDGKAEERFDQVRKEVYAAIEEAAEGGAFRVYLSVYGRVRDEFPYVQRRLESALSADRFKYEWSANLEYLEVTW